MFPRSLSEQANDVLLALETVTFNNNDPPIHQSKTEKAQLHKEFDDNGKICAKQLIKLKTQLARIANSANKDGLSKEKEKLDQLVETAENLAQFCRLMKQPSPDPDEFKTCFNAVNDIRDLSAHCVARLLETKCQEALMYSDYELFAGLFFEQSCEAPPVHPTCVVPLCAQ